MASQPSAPQGQPPERKDGSQHQTQYFRYAGLGFQFAGTFMVLGAVGWWLDGKLGTAPWLMLIGIALGAAGGFYSMVRRVPGGLGTTSHDHDPK